MLNSTAKNDYAKVRELARILVGVTNPNISKAEFQTHLDSNDMRLFQEARNCVEANYSAIFDLMQFFARKFVAAKTASFTLPAAEIDDFLAKKPIVAI